MPTFIIRCKKCGDEKQTSPTAKHSDVEKMVEGDQCHLCGGQFVNVPLGGTGFQLSQRDVKGSIGSARGSGFESRGRCLGKSL